MHLQRVYRSATGGQTRRVQGAKEKRTWRTLDKVMLFPVSKHLHHKHCKSRLLRLVGLIYDGCVAANAQTHREQAVTCHSSIFAKLSRRVLHILSETQKQPCHPKYAIPHVIKDLPLIVYGRTSVF